MPCPFKQIHCGDKDLGRFRGVCGELGSDLRVTGSCAVAIRLPPPSETGVATGGGTERAVGDGLAASDDGDLSVDLG